jgi:hypothetical protein
MDRYHDCQGANKVLKKNKAYACTLLENHDGEKEIGQIEFCVHMKERRKT